LDNVQDHIVEHILQEADFQDIKAIIDNPQLFTLVKNNNTASLKRI